MERLAAEPADAGGDALLARLDAQPAAFVDAAFAPDLLAAVPPSSAELRRASAVTPASHSRAQGRLASCWLLAAIDALAPAALLARLLVRPRVSARGAVAVRLCVAGRWTVVRCGPWPASISISAIC